ncbi:phage baseplate plug family protein [Herbaspirillum huttiense]|uniref:phage baseplate plug family protein n=1 Tax=Herbaspirillum huttiense TaxID=863372 RepID=UPI0031D6341C
MSTNYEIPLTAEPQAFSIALAGTTYQFTVRWNAISAAWIIDIADASGAAIVSGIPMVTGVDMLEQFDYLNFGFQLVAQTDNDPDAVPDFAGLGTTGHLYAIVP